MPWLEWLTRDRDIKVARAVPYRLMEPVPDLSYGDPTADNLLIEGDNLQALKALLPYYAGQVKCIYIDPPYNTKSAFEQYDDNLEHSQWLAMMYPRLELLREFLSEDGSIWISIDDNEGHYLKVVCDEVFGRRNFVDTIVWRKNYSPKSSARHFSSDHDYIIVYATNAEYFVPNLIERSIEQDRVYRNLDDDPRGLWRPDNLTARNPYRKGLYSVKCPGGRVIERPPAGRYWAVSQERLTELDSEKRIWWGRDGNGVPALKRFLLEVKQGRVVQTVWHYDEVGHTQDAKKEAVSLNGESVFDTPKPEALIKRILDIATNPGDLVMDSFLGSGTTAAVAHKMGRRYVGIELGAHAKTHCAPRLQKVVDGEQGGISQVVGWAGGGGFRFLRLGDPVFDADGRIADTVPFGALAAHIWFLETGRPLPALPDGRSPLLGVHDGAAIYLLYNGVLGDRRPNGGNILTRGLLTSLPPHRGRRIIYAEGALMSEGKLEREGIVFRQMPYDAHTR